MNDHRKPPSPALSIAYSATAELTIELAKMLALVAPTSMSEEQQELWLRAAADALEGIRANEVQAVAAEVKRSVTRHNQIVPAIAEKVAEKRRSPSATAASPYAAEMAINREGQERRAKAHGDKRKMAEAYEWERQARIAAGLHVEPNPPPLSRDELENMLPHIRHMGLSSGLLEYRDGLLREVRL